MRSRAPCEFRPAPAEETIQLVVITNPHRDECLVTVDRMFGVFAARCFTGDQWVQQTTPPARHGIALEDLIAAQPARDHIESRTEAAVLIDRIQSDAGLTLEQLAPLAGVSRRTLQTWRAGGSISGRKGDKLRVLADVVEALSTGDTEQTRRKLFGRAPGDVSIYGLLREGRLATALARARGELVSIDDSEGEGVLDPLPPIDVRLGLREDAVTTRTSQVDAKRARRIQRRRA